MIPVCVKCKRELKRDTFRGMGDGSMTGSVGPMAVREILFKCPKNHAFFKVGNLDLLEITKYPIDKVKFESAPNLDPRQFPVLPYRQ